MKLLLIFVLVVVPCTARAQTVQVTAGASSLLGAQGGAVTLYTADSTSTVGIGFAGGHLVAGANTLFPLYGYVCRAGDSQIFLSTVDTGVAVDLRGVELTRAGLTVFAGLTGSAFNTPFFTATRASNFGAGVQYNHHFGNLGLSSVAVVTHGVRTFLQGADYHRSVFRFQGSAGLLENHPFINLSGAGQWPHFAMTANRETFIMQGARTTSSSVGVFAQGGPLNVNASAFESRGVVGLTGGAGARVGFVEVRGQVFDARGQKTLSGSITENLSRHLRVSQYATESNGKPTFSAGGSYVTNRFAVSVDQSSYFSPQGFRQSLGVTLSFHIRDLNFSAQTVRAPDGSTKLTAYAGTYIQASGLAPGVHTAQRHMHGYIVRGIVIDDHGAPVDGAAVRVGSEILYTDLTGCFQTRVKRNKAVLVTLVPEEFTAGGLWEAESGGVSVLPGTEVKIKTTRLK